MHPHTTITTRLNGLVGITKPTKKNVMRNPRKINVKGIEVEIRVMHDDADRTAKYEIATQDICITEELEYINNAGWNDDEIFEAYEDQVMDGLDLFIVEEKAKGVAKHVARLTQFAVTHNLMQSKTKISVEYDQIESDIIITVWGNFKSTTDRVGDIIAKFECPTIGENEYDVKSEDGCFNPYHVLTEIKKVI